MNIVHYEQAQKLWKQSEEVELTIGDSKDSLNNYLSRNPVMSFVCIDKRSSSLVGTILCGHDGRRGFIYHLAVHKEYRNKSIGKTLIRHSIAALKAAGIERCIIMVKTFNKIGDDFWSKIGWRKRNDLIMYSNDLNG